MNKFKNFLEIVLPFELEIVVGKQESLEAFSDFLAYVEMLFVNLLMNVFYLV